MARNAEESDILGLNMYLFKLRLMRRDLDRLRDLVAAAEKTPNYRGTIYQNIGPQRDPTLSMSVYYGLEVQEAALVRLPSPRVNENA